MEEQLCWPKTLPLHELTPDKLALRFIDAQFTPAEITYDALLRSANRFANL